MAALLAYLLQALGALFPWLHRDAPAPVASALTQVECGMDTVAGNGGRHQSWNSSTREACLEACRAWLCQPGNDWRQEHARCVWKGAAIAAYAPTAGEPPELLPNVLTEHSRGCWTVTRRNAVLHAAAKGAEACLSACRATSYYGEATTEWACFYEGRVLDSRPASARAPVPRPLPGETPPACK